MPPIAFRPWGKAAGRCYLMKAAYSREVWRWTVYGISGGGIEDTLAEAQRRFKETYEAALIVKVGRELG
jgi:hypothetical protein